MPGIRDRRAAPRWRVDCFPGQHTGWGRWTLSTTGSSEIESVVRAIEDSAGEIKDLRQPYRDELRRFLKNGKRWWQKAAYRQASERGPGDVQYVAIRESGCLGFRDLVEFSVVKTETGEVEVYGTGYSLDHHCWTCLPCCAPFAACSWVACVACCCGLFPTKDWGQNQNTLNAVMFGSHLEVQAETTGDGLPVWVEKAPKVIDAERSYTQS